MTEFEKLKKENKDLLELADKQNKLIADMFKHINITTILASILVSIFLLTAIINYYKNQG